MIVTDTNIIAYLYLPSPQTETVARLFSQEPAWSAPRLWRSEFRNILATYMSTGTLLLPQALEVQRHAERLMAGNEFDVPSAEVLALASESGCSAYDCEFVYLARHEGLHLITSDRKVRRRFPETAMDAATYLESL